MYPLGYVGRCLLSYRAEGLSEQVSCITESVVKRSPTGSA